MRRRFFHYMRLGARHRSRLSAPSRVSGDVAWSFRTRHYRLWCWTWQRPRNRVFEVHCRIPAADSGLAVLACCVPAVVPLVVGRDLQHEKSPFQIRVAGEKFVCLGGGVRDLREVLCKKVCRCASGEFKRGNGDGKGRACSSCSHRIKRYDSRSEVAIKNTNTKMAIDSNFDSLVLRGDQRVSCRSSFIHGGFIYGARSQLV